MSQVELNLRSKLLGSVMLADYQAADKIGSGPFVEMAGLASLGSAKLLQMGAQGLKLFFVIFFLFCCAFFIHFQCWVHSGFCWSPCFISC